jgi:integrase
MFLTMNRPVLSNTVAYTCDSDVCRFGISATREDFNIPSAAVTTRPETVQEPNPMDGLELPPDTRPKKKKPFLYPAQLTNLLELIPEPYATMVHTAVWTGLRVSELLALKWYNVGPDWLRVDQSYCRGQFGKTKTGASAATISVMPHVIERIERMKTLTVEVRAGRAVRRYKLVKDDNSNGVVFQSVKDGKPMNDQNILRRYIRPAAQTLGLKGIDWRCLRRTCATWMVQAGADPKSVQGQMRHSRITTTMEIYAQQVPEGQRRAVEQMQEYARRSAVESGTNPVTVSVQ